MIGPKQFLNEKYGLGFMGRKLDGLFGGETRTWLGLAAGLNDDNEELRKWLNTPRSFRYAGELLWGPE